MDYFWSPNKGLREGKKKKREIKLRYGIFVWIHDFGMDSSVELYDFCT